MTEPTPTDVENSGFVCPRCSTTFRGAECPVCHGQRAKNVENVSTEPMRAYNGSSTSVRYLMLYLLVAAVLGVFSPAIVLFGAFIGYFVDLFSKGSADFGTAIVLLLKWFLIGALAFVPAVIIGIFIYGPFTR